MTTIIEKRRSLHRSLTVQQQQNDELQLQLSQLQALANIGVNTSMIAHEINNLLTPLANYATLSLSHPEDKALAEKALQKTAKNSQRAIDVMQSILAIANGETQQRQNCKLTVLIDEIFSCLCRDFAKDSITVKIEVPQNLTIFAVPAEIQQVLMNLILNARDAMLPKGGKLTINALETPEAVQITVSDTGNGIEPENLKKIFEPFFTTKTNQRSTTENSGSGLGLAFCKKIIYSYGGRITVRSKRDKLTTFGINLPKP